MIYIICMYSYDNVIVCNCCSFLNVVKKEKGTRSNIREIELCWSF